jgi:hypothetical protein
VSNQEKEMRSAEGPSRRISLGTGSAALAATFVGLAANAQQREDTRKAEGIIPRAIQGRKIDHFWMRIRIRTRGLRKIMETSDQSGTPLISRGSAWTRVAGRIR